MLMNVQNIIIMLSNMQIRSAKHYVNFYLDKCDKALIVTKTITTVAFQNSLVNWIITSSCCKSVMK